MRVTCTVEEVMQMRDPLLVVEDLKKYYPVKVGIFGKVVAYVKAVDGVSFDINYGEVLSLVGESGSGKTTIAKCILLLERPTAGKIIFEGTDVLALGGKELKHIRRNVQAVFQNPFLSLNPRMNVLDIVSEPITTHLRLTRREVEERVHELLELVGLERSIARKYPHELSGGQAQRVAIARAIALNPKLVVLDEPTSALDVSVQAQLLNLLAELKEKLELSYLMISHDLSVVRYVSDRVAVIYLGKVLERGGSEQLFGNPMHPYTQALVSSIPDPQTKMLGRRVVLKGEPPSSIAIPPGCRFHTRCHRAMSICSKDEPPEVKVEAGHTVACWLYARR